MFHRTKVCTAVLTALGGVALMGGTPAFGQQELQRVEVTGSNIKRINAETVAPVEVITREQIVRTGQSTLADVLRALPANGGGSFGESFSNSFAPGAAGISLRGLGEKTTLVLLNGRRVSGYGFAQNLQDTFVDLNAIPASAVERVEILKDGASALYGSDAIAGVVNIILRREFKGFEASIGAGTTKGGGEASFNLIGGLGELGVDKFNAFAVLDYYKRDLLTFADTKFGASRDFRNYAGGRNYTSLTGNGTWRQYTAAGAATNTYRAISGCEAFGGKVLNGQQALAAGLINPNTAANIAQSAVTNTFCSHDYNDQFTALPGTERIGVLARATYDLTSTAQLYAELGLNSNKTHQTFQNAAPASTGLTSTPAGLRPFPYTVNFAPGVAGNPFTTGLARYVGVLNDIGTRDNDIKSDSLRLLVGAKYTVGTWDLDSGVSFSKNKVTALNQNRITLAGTSALFGIGTGVQPPVPTSTSSTYNLDNPALNSQAVRDSFTIDFPRRSTSELTTFDTKASTELAGLKLPGGNVGLALGFEFRREKLNDSPAAIAQGGGILGQGITATNGSRTSTAFYGELGLPILKSLEGQLALRYDKYSDYGSSTTPKVGLKWTPADFIAIRANYGKGFRAPTLPEISPSVATFFTSVTDPEDDTTRQISGVFAGNPNLKAEKSTSATLGFVLEPTKNVNVSVDFYRINWRDIVASQDFQDIIDASCPNPPGSDGGGPCPSTGQVLRDPATNQVVSIFSNYQNLTSRVTTGIDIDGRIALPPTDFGKFGARLNLNYVTSFKEEGTEYVGTNGGSNTYPRVKAAISVDWDQGPWSVTGKANYTHSIRQDALAGSYRTPQDPRFQNGVYPDRIGSYTTVDLFARYTISKNFTVSASVVNVFDKTPPFDVGFDTTNLYDFSLHDVRGRRFNFTLNYKM